jgi:hypothetical protein
MARIEGSDRFRTVRRAAVAVWVALSALLVLVWGLIGVFAHQMVTPWFLWAVGGGGIVVGLVLLLTSGRTTEAGARP